MSEQASGHLLLKEFEQINDYARTLFTIGISWYTFFITANAFAISLFLSDVLKGDGVPPRLMLPVGTVFVLVNVLATSACQLAASYCVRWDGRLKAIIGSTMESESKSAAVQSPLPLGLAKPVIRIMQASLVVVSVFWIVFVILSTG